MCTIWNINDAINFVIVGRIRAFNSGGEIIEFVSFLLHDMHYSAKHVAGSTTGAS